MYDKIEKMYQSAYQMSREYLIEQGRNGVGQVEKMFPEIQEFSLWFLEGNKFGLKEEMYQEMQNYLLQVLKDIANGIAQKDRVLLHDAIAYGLMEYLKMFIDAEHEEGEGNGL